MTSDRGQASLAKMTSLGVGKQRRHATRPNLKTKLTNEPFSLQTLLKPNARFMADSLPLQPKIDEKVL
jgi:hypothetical protein